MWDVGSELFNQIYLYVWNTSIFSMAYDCFGKCQIRIGIGIASKENYSRLKAASYTCRMQLGFNGQSVEDIYESISISRIIDRLKSIRRLRSPLTVHRYFRCIIIVPFFSGDEIDEPCQCIVLSISVALTLISASLYALARSIGKLPFFESIDIKSSFHCTNFT